MKVNSIHDKQENYAWMPLDNAAKIYPAVQSREFTIVFRISAILNDPVNYSCLVRAIQKAELRFPYFKVTLKKGFFWYYLEHVDRPLSLSADIHGCCRSFFFPRTENPFLLRITVVRNKLSVEFSHILTDGAGAMAFLTALLAAYFSEKSPEVPAIPGFKPDEPMSVEEFEDAYNRYFNSEIPRVVNYTKAFHLPFELNRKKRFHVLSGVLDLCDILSKSREKGLSVTEYLVSVYLFVLQEIYHELPLFSRHKRSKIIRIQVPVNLRKIYPTRSMRNFSLFVLPEIDLRLGDYTFEEIVKIVYHKMQLETDEKVINKIIARNVGSERNLIVRGIPLFIKNLILRWKFYSKGPNQYSGVVTNLGKVELPDEMAGHISRLVFIPPPPNQKLKVNCGVIGFQEKLVVSFGNITTSLDLEKKFFRFLADQGIHVKLTVY
ncbi:MAG: hypothetical protein JW830_05890 [Bacteroidales bacterium]|nr:hypothetical protein [Bacteroidales bacterium]